MNNIKLIDSYYDLNRKWYIYQYQNDNGELEVISISESIDILYKK